VFLLVFFNCDTSSSPKSYSQRVASRHGFKAADAENLVQEVQHSISRVLPQRLQRLHVIYLRVGFLKVPGLRSLGETRLRVPFLCQNLGKVVFSLVDASFS
jgi:hypothetical protein